MRNYDKDLLMNFIKENNVKTAGDLEGTFRELYKDMIEVMLNNEMTDHLGYEKRSIV